MISPKHAEAAIETLLDDYSRMAAEVAQREKARTQIEAAYASEVALNRRRQASIAEYARQYAEIVESRAKLQTAFDKQIDVIRGLRAALRSEVAAPDPAETT